MVGDKEMKVGLERPKAGALGQSEASSTGPR